MYEPDYTEEFLDDLKRYASLRKLAWKNVRRILEDPYLSLLNSFLALS
jgi:hypothetical protein